MFDSIRCCLRHPSIFRAHDHILLLSHMRANTSLLGHVLGANPEVEGYYELHIGYYSWKSFYRQKILHYQKHTPKANARYFFDKILHSEHEFCVERVPSDRLQLIFSVREPQQTVRSIVSLYQQRNPHHQFATVRGAATYYLDRLPVLVNMASRAPAGFTYVDSQALRDRTDEALEFLTQNLSLTVPLTSTYKAQKLTGTPKAGDLSDNLMRGRIEPGSTSYTDIDLMDCDVAELESVYVSARSRLIELSRQAFVV